MNFWETSALVALGVDEPHRQTALHILEADDRMAVWWGATVEYVAALSRRERDASLTTDEVSEHLVRLHALSHVWYEVQPSRRIAMLAQRLLRVHPLRAADSLQLAAAIARVDRYGNRAGQRDAEQNLDEFDRCRQQHRHMIARPDPERDQGARAVDAPLRQVAEGVAGRRQDQRVGVRPALFGADEQIADRRRFDCARHRQTPPVRQFEPSP